MPYLPRVVDEELVRRLSSAGAVVIEGPKACGKTETAMQQAASSVLLDVDLSARQALAIDPSLVLEGPAPRLLDEWQVEPMLWNHVRRAVDAAGTPGRFILTGSSVPTDDANRHGGAGRFSTLRMRPMTLLETGHSTGVLSLAALFDGVPARSAAPALTIPDLADRITVGGWPALQDLAVADAARGVRDYLDQIRLVDVSRVAGGSRDPRRVERLLQTLARNTATVVAATVLAVDAGDPGTPLARNTVADYLGVLDRLMIIEDVPVWAAHLRSKATLRQASKRHFVDPSLAVAALGAGPARLLKDLSFMGLLFESMVIRDLRVFAQGLGGSVHHYRDNNGLEVDAIVQLADGRWGAVEVKLGAGMVDSAAITLRAFADIVDTARCGPPSFLAVVTGNGYGLRRPDGVDVVPIGALGP